MHHHTIGRLAIVLGLLAVTGCGPKGVPEKPQVVAEQTAAKPAVEPTERLAADAVTVELPSLGAELAAMTAQGKERMPPEMVQVFADGIQEVRDTGIVDAALNVGDQAIDATLPNAQGEEVKLSDLWSNGPVVVVWYRGGWCPYCNLQLHAMQEALPALKAEGATLVAISPETPDNSLSTREKNNLEYTVLSDAGNEVAKKYGVVFKLPEKVSPIYKQMIGLEKYNGNESDELPLAATYVIDNTGKIRYAFLDADYTKRAEPKDVVEALREF